MSYDVRVVTNHVVRHASTGTLCNDLIVAGRCNRMLFIDVIAREAVHIGGLSYACTSLTQWAISS